MELLDLDWTTIWSHLILMAVAYTLSLPIAWNRERNNRSAGLRTFPLVAVATCGFMLVGIDVFTDEMARSRVLEGVITGMGFIGGGAILKRSKVVSGTATATSLWTTGAIGIAVAWHRFEIALVMSLLTFITLQLAPEVKTMVNGDSEENSESGS